MVTPGGSWTDTAPRAAQRPAVRAIDLSFNLLEHCACLHLFPELRELKLYANRLSELPPLAACVPVPAAALACDPHPAPRHPSVPKLQALLLSDNKLARLSDDFRVLTQLRNLWLDNNKLQDVAVLARLTAIETLNLRRNALTSVQVRRQPTSPPGSSNDGTPLTRPPTTIPPTRAHRAQRTPGAVPAAVPPVVGSQRQRAAQRGRPALAAGAVRAPVLW